MNFLRVEELSDIFLRSRDAIYSKKLLLIIVEAQTAAVDYQVTGAVWRQTGR